MVRGWIRSFVLLAAALLASGCAAQAPEARTSRLTGRDIIETGDQVRASLADSALLAGRDRTSPPIKLGLAEAVNKSSDRLAAADRWALTALVVYDFEVQQLLESRNVRLYLPEDTQGVLESMGLGPGSRVDPGWIDRTAPTHVLRAEIRSLARQGSAVAGAVSDHRQDVYLIDYRIVEFDSSRVVWSRTVEWARRATGTVAD
ncbi:MAG: hypothetical protein L6Q35_14960 [Phycisphaerales bacterium]|nr:hypothetical protein [Phycisphaerales bacterium]